MSTISSPFDKDDEMFESVSAEKQSNNINNDKKNKYIERERRASGKEVDKVDGTGSNDLNDSNNNNMATTNGIKDENTNDFTNNNKEDAPNKYDNEGNEQVNANAVEEQDGPIVVIDPNKDLWQNISDNVRGVVVEQTEVQVLMVGSGSSGKTTLLQKFSGAASAQIGSSSSSSNTTTSTARKVKPTTALDYSFHRRVERNNVQITHFWELAQGNELSQLADIVLCAENVHNTVVIIVVDASPAHLPVLWSNLVYWLQRVDRRVSEIVQKMKAKGSSTPEKMLNKARKNIGADHPDLSRMRLTGVPTLVVLNKMDEFDGDSSMLRLLIRTLRYLSHLYGASFMTMSEMENVNKWRNVLSHLLFQVPLENCYVQLDPEKGAVLVTPDKDSFVDIGEPPSPGYRTSEYTSSSSGDAELDRWKFPFDEIFPPQPSSFDLNESKTLDDPFLKRLYEMGDDGYGDSVIDTLRRQKDEELEQYRRLQKSKTKQ